MRILIHDQGPSFPEKAKNQYNRIICADGHYAPCQGCFKCWTKHPAECELKDSLHEMCRVIGQADELVIVTENCYGGYSPAVKNLLDRSIGVSTPMSTYRGRLMHHTLRYGRHEKLRVFVTGDISDREKKTWELTAERNALNFGYAAYEVNFVNSMDAPEAAGL